MSVSDKWQNLGIVASGGTVSSIAVDSAGCPWLATEAGLFYWEEDSWRPAAHGQPFSSVSALTKAGKTLVAGNSAGQIAFSDDGGLKWYLGHIGQANEPITCLAASPSFDRDGVLLAGTNGAGVLRSTDGGRRWQLSNFGLQGFAVLAVATAPQWSRREVAFVATSQGLYRSPNGGRAWKHSNLGLHEAIVQSVAPSPHFEQDGTVWAGTETHGLFRSVDGGQTWHAVPLPSSKAASKDMLSINAIWLQSDSAFTVTVLVGAGDGRIFRSGDDGSSWECVASAPYPILCLAQAGRLLYAGLYRHGLLISTDGGATWQVDSGLAARAITRLACQGDGGLVAWGMSEGAWHSPDRGRTWEAMAGLEDHLLLSIASSPSADHPCLLAGTSRGLFRSEDAGKGWQAVMQERVTGILFSPRFVQDGRVWVGTRFWNSILSEDAGWHWSSSSSPDVGARTLWILAIWTAGDRDFWWLQLSHPDRRRATVWHSADYGHGWDSLIQEQTPWPAVHLGGGDQPDGYALIQHRRYLLASSPPCDKISSEGQQSLVLPSFVCCIYPKPPVRCCLLPDRFSTQSMI